MVTKISQTVKNPGIICKFKDREKTFFGNSGSNVLAAAGQKGKRQERSGDHPDERQVGLAPQEHLEESHQLRRRKSVTGAAQQHKQGEPPHKRDALGNLFKVPVDFAAVNNEERCHQPHRNGIHVQTQKVGELVYIGLHGSKYKKAKNRIIYIIEKIPRISNAALHHHTRLQFREVCATYAGEHLRAAL